MAAKASNEAHSSGRKNALRLLLDAQDENGEKVGRMLPLSVCGKECADPLLESCAEPCAYGRFLLQYICTDTLHSDFAC